MMALLKEGPLDLLRLKEKSILFISLIWYLQLPDKGQPITERLLFTITELRSKVEDGRKSKSIHGTEAEMDKLMELDLVRFNDENKYELTEEGKEIAIKSNEKIKNWATTMDSELNPSITAKNTTFLDAFLALLKLGSGLLSGSMGLIADGTDAFLNRRKIRAFDSNPFSF